MSNFKALKKKYELKAQHKNLLVTEIDGTKAATMSDIFQILKKDLQFPAYFGENSDALFDMLCDFSWLDDSIEKVHIVVKNYDTLLQNEHRNVKLDFLTILNDACNEWADMAADAAIKFEVHIEPANDLKKDIADAEI